MAKTHDWALNGDYTDSIGGLTLSAVNSPTAVGTNTGFDFNGTDQRARNTSYTKPSGARTLMVWIKAKAANYTNARFVSNGHATTLNDTIGTSSGQLINFRLGTRRATGGSTHTFSTVAKTFLAAVFNGSATTGYYATEGDPSVTSVADTAAVTEVTPTIIGLAANTETTAVNWTSVEIYRVVEFDTALSEAEINSWLAAGSEADPSADTITITTPVLPVAVVIKATGTPSAAMCSVANKGQGEPLSVPVSVGSLPSFHASSWRNTVALSVAWL